MKNESEKKKLYTTTRGVTVELLGVSPLFIAELQASVELPEKPFRVIPTDLEGYEEKEELTPDDLRTEEEKKQWDSYSREVAELLTERHQKFIKAILARGVRFDLNDMESWKEEQKYWGLEVPDHPIDQKIKYVQSEVIGGMDDIINIISGVLGQTGIPEEEMKRIESMFRDSIRRNTAGKAEAA